MSDWRDPAADALEGSSPGLRVQHVVVGTEEGEVRYGFVVHDDGRVEHVEGEVADPDVTLTRPLGEALAVQRGEMSANASFISGRTKVAGDTGPLLRYLAAAG